MVINKSDNLYEPVAWLQSEGFSAYIVGNQVRDLLLGTVGDRSDVDIATSATPGEVATIVKRHRIGPSLVDEKFGVTTFVYNHTRFEATTFRQDMYGEEFADIKRYPDQIVFIKTPKQDVIRRDLTINAIYYNPTTNRYLDYVGGVADLESGIIRVVGDPKIRFLEDPIRMLRCIRFRHQLGFRYEARTKAALIKWAHLISKVSPTVIKKEMQKLQSLENYAQAKQDLIHFGFIKLT